MAFISDQDDQQSCQAGCQGDWDIDNSTSQSRSQYTGTGTCSSSSFVERASSKGWTRSLGRRKNDKLIMFDMGSDSFFSHAHSTTANRYPHYRSATCSGNMSRIRICMEWGQEEYQLIHGLVREEFKKPDNSSNVTSQKSIKSEISSDSSGMEQLLTGFNADEEKELSLPGKLQSLSKKMLAKMQKYDLGLRLVEVNPIPPSCTNFLHTALLTLKPEYAEGPFLMFGIELRCVNGLEQIYIIEGLSKKNFIPKENVGVSDMPKVIAKLIKTAMEFNKCQDMKQNIMSRITTSLLAFLEVELKEGRKQWRTFKKKFQESDLASALVTRLLVAGKSKNPINEEQLLDFLSDYITLDKDCCIFGRPPSKRIPQFKCELAEDSIGQYNMTDMEFVFIQKLVGFGIYREDDSDENDSNDFAENERKEVSGSRIPQGTVPSVPILVHKNRTSSPVELKIAEELIKTFDEGRTLGIHTELLLQCWTQSFAALMNAEYEIQGENAVVLQSCTLVIGQWVRSCVLCIDMDMYIALMKIDNAMEMLDWIIREMNVKDVQSWCRFYVNGNSDQVLDIIEELKFVSKNFCMSVERESDTQL